MIGLYKEIFIKWVPGPDGSRSVGELAGGTQKIFTDTTAIYTSQEERVTNEKYAAFSDTGAYHSPMDAHHV